MSMLALVTFGTGCVSSLWPARMHDFGFLDMSRTSMGKMDRRLMLCRTAAIVAAVGFAGRAAAYDLPRAVAF